ncbi:MAG TPA: dihydropteroate synthase [Terriglobia bacterium]|nr:dihydropteroate synthase [Terriglobia bacterium]
MRNRFTWRLPRASVALGERTAVMGILNVTPDSFSDGGMYFDRQAAIARAKQIEEEGADIIDVGGESTRPGSEEISEEEELRRVLPVIEALASVVKIPISIDTYRSNVARRAIEAGAQIVNDISGFRFDTGIARVVNDGRAGVVLMHSRGRRDSLHTQSRMADPIHEVTEGLSASVAEARRAGISSNAIVIDPGIGFGKAADESLRVLKSLNQFSKLGYPLLVGTSRKSFIRRLTAEASAEAINWGTAATIVAAIMGGAHIVRVHDVRQSRALANMTDRIILA